MDLGGEELGELSGRVALIVVVAWLHPEQLIEAAAAQLAHDVRVEDAEAVGLHRGTGGGGEGDHD